jgi:hypothetical protein
MSFCSWRHALLRLMPSHGADKWEVQGQLGHRGGVKERHPEYAPDHRAQATAAIEAFWKKVNGYSPEADPVSSCARFVGLSCISRRFRPLLWCLFLCLRRTCQT